MGWLCAPSDNYPMHGMLQQRGGRLPALRSKRPLLRNELFLYALQILLIELIFFELTKTAKRSIVFAPATSSRLVSEIFMQIIKLQYGNVAPHSPFYSKT